MKAFKNPLRHCVVCLYRAGWGNTRIAKHHRINKGLIGKWVRKAGVKEIGRSTRNTLAGNGISLGNQLIIAHYKREQRAASRPDRMRAACYTKKYSENATRRRNYQNARLQQDWKFRAIFYARKRIRQFMKQRRMIKSFSATAAIGCTPSQLRDYIQAQFRDGMSWNNHGNVWHIDHVIPLASATNAKQVRSLCHFSNLQPLLVTENHTKRDKTIKQELLPL